MTQLTRWLHTMSRTPEELRESRRKYREQPNNKAKEAEYTRAYRARPEVKSKQADQQREYHAKPENKAKAIERRRKRNERPEEKIRIADYSREYVLRPGVKELRSKRAALPENKAKAAEIRKLPEEKAKRAENNRKNRARPEVKARRVEINRKRRATDPQFRIACLLRGRLSAALRNKQKRGSAVELLGCTIPELVTHLEEQFTDGMSWESQGAWHIDHILPLSSFDLEDLEQLKIACHYTNLQPLWASDNCSKGSKVA